MDITDLEVPWNLLPIHIKEWVRQNGYVIRESENSVTYLSKWRQEYLKYIQL